MALLQKWRKKQLATRIVFSTVFIPENTSLEEFVSMLSDTLTLKQLQRVDGIIRKYPDYSTHLTKMFMAVYPHKIDRCIDQIELVITTLHEVASKRSDILDKNEVRFCADEVVDRVLRYIQHSNTPALTEQQVRALITVDLLLMIRGLDDHAPDVFPKPVGYIDRYTSGTWLTNFTLANAYDPDAVFTAHVERSKLRVEVARTLDRDGDIRAVPEMILNYPADVIRWLHDLSVMNRGNFNIAKRLAKDGTTAEQMHWVQHFTERLPEISFFRVASAATGLYNYPVFKDHAGSTKLPQKVEDQSMALVLVAIASKRHSSSSMNSDGTFKDPRFFDLLMEHPDRGESLSALITERGSTDFDFLQGITSSALGEGIL